MMLRKRLNIRATFVGLLFTTAIVFLFSFSYPSGSFNLKRIGQKDAVASFTTGDKLYVKSNESKIFLTAKVSRAFEYVYTRYNDHFDWILKADDDTYVVIENLKLLLSNFDPREASHIGCHFKKHMSNRTLPNGYMSGGAGYVISSSALRHLVMDGFHHKNCNVNKLIGNEDVEIAKCLATVKTKVFSSLDIEGKHTFHAEHLGKFLQSPHPYWLKEWSWTPPKFGRDCCTRYPITFHHLNPVDIMLYEQLLYRTNVVKNVPGERVYQTKLEMTN